MERNALRLSNAATEQVRKRWQREGSEVSEVMKNWGNFFIFISIEREQSGEDSENCATPMVSSFPHNR